MAPLVIITVPCDTKPCNISEAVIRFMDNLTSTESPDGSQKDYDSEGAARFIIATVLVYSLMGVFGMLLLRIKRSASRTRRSTSTREESVMRYIKRTDRLMQEAKRDVLRREAERTNNRLDFLRQKSEESNPTSDAEEFTPLNSLAASFNSSHLGMAGSPTATNLSLLMPLLPAVQETSSEVNTTNNNNNNQNVIPNIVFHFPALPPLAISQLSNPNTTSQSLTSTPTSAVCISYPDTRGTELNDSLQNAAVDKKNASEQCVGTNVISKSSTTDCNMNDTDCGASITNLQTGNQNNSSNIPPLDFNSTAV